MFLLSCAEKLEARCERKTHVSKITIYEVGGYSSVTFKHKTPADKNIKMS